MQVQSQYSLIISRESFQQQESVEHLPGLLPEFMSPCSSGPTSAFRRAHTSVLYAYWEFHLDTACTWSSKCLWLFLCLLACYFNHHGFNKLAKVVLLRSLVVWESLIWCYTWLGQRWEAVYCFVVKCVHGMVAVHGIWECWCWSYSSSFL